MKIVLEQQIIKEYIQRNYKIGERIPSERKLSEQLQQSRVAVRSAIKELTDSEYLEFISPKIRAVNRKTSTPLSCKNSSIVATIGQIHSLKSESSENLSINDKQIYGVFHAIEMAKNMRLDIPDNGIEVFFENQQNAVVRGLIYFNYFKNLDAILRQYFHKKLPIVSFGDSCFYFDFENRFYDTVSSNQYLGANLIIENIPKKGGKSILYVNTANNRFYWSMERYRGMTSCCQQLGITFAEVQFRIESNCISSQQVFDLHSQLLSKKLAYALGNNPNIDSIVVTCDDELPIVANALAMLGLNFRDFIIAGYDNSYNLQNPFYEKVTPNITVDKQDIKIGQEAIALLNRRINGELAPQVQNVLIEPILIEPVS